MCAPFFEQILILFCFKRRFGFRTSEWFGTSDRNKSTTKDSKIVAHFPFFTVGVYYTVTGIDLDIRKKFLIRLFRQD